MVLAAIPERNAVVKAVALQSLRLPSLIMGLEMEATTLDQPFASIIAVRSKVAAMMDIRRISGQKTLAAMNKKLNLVFCNRRISSIKAKSSQTMVWMRRLVILLDKAIEEV